MEGLPIRRIQNPTGMGQHQYPSDWEAEGKHSLNINAKKDS